MTTVLSKPKIKNRRKKTVYTPIILKNDEKTIEELLSKKSETEIKSLYDKKDLIELKCKIIISRIKKLRNESALKIQEIWNRNRFLLKVHKVAHKVKGCYTVYPNIQNACKMFIKIFTNELNKKEFKIIPLDFCQIRKCFLKDIPKNKFYTSRKIMYFNFIKGGEIFFDEKYEKVIYSNEMVHKVDFSTYDIKQKFLDENIYNPNKLFPKKVQINSNNSKDLTYLSTTEDEKEYSDNSALTPEKFGKTIFKFSSSKIENKNEIDEEDEYSGLRSLKRRGSNEPVLKKKLNKKYKRKKRFESFDSTYSTKFKVKSILKDSNSEELHKRKLNRESERKVSFGEAIYLD